MWEKLQQFALLAKSVFFSVAIHCILLALLLFSFNWTERIEPGTVKPIQATIVSEQELLASVKIAQQAQSRPQPQVEEKPQIKTQKQQAIEKECRIILEKLRDELRKPKQPAPQQTEQECRATIKKLKAELRKQKQLEAKRKEEARQKKQKAEKRQQQEQALLAKNKKEAENALNKLYGQIKRKVEQNWRQPQTSVSAPSATIRVKVDCTGQVTLAQVIRSSGNRFFDDSVQLAVQKSSPLPFPSNPKYCQFINQFNINFKLDNVP